MKYYVVSEEELMMLRYAAFAEGYAQGPWENPEARAVAQAEATCRARPLSPEHIPEDLFKALIGVKGYSLRSWVKAPDWATHFAHIQDEGEPLVNYEEIKK